jgi:DNA polymerase-3 subunit gamma/tau
MSDAAVAVAVETTAGQPDNSQPASVEQLRARVLASVQDSSGLLEEGEWELRGGELVVKVPASDTVAELALSAEARRTAAQAASAAAGRPMKVRVVGGGNAQPGQRPTRSAPAEASNSNGGARARAMQDPVVRRMQEKFGAEIRTVIDYKEKR